MFSPEVLDPASQISFVAAGGVPTEKLIVGTGTSEEGGYTGKYLSIDGSEIGENLWVDIHLTPRQSIESYAEYDIVEFWVYFVMTGENAKIGILGGSTAATDPLLREFAGNTWAKISVDADTFFDKIDSARLFTVNFNNATSGNHAGLTEVRIGTVMAKYAFGPEVTVDAPEAVTGGTSAVTLTADTDVAFTAQIKNDKDEVQECVVENGAVTASLPMGSYTYTLTSQDDMYIGSVTGSFTVESKTKIVLPEAAAGTAGTAYTIPDASVTVDGAVQEGEKATCTATFVQGLNGKKSEQVESGFVPLTAGTLTVVYSYEGAASQTLTVEIAAAQPAGNVVFDPSTATNGNFTSTNGSLHAAVAGDPEADYTGSYISITQSGTNVWSNLHLHLGDVSYAEYDVIEFWVYFVMTGENAKIGILGGSTGATDPLLRELAGNTWAKISVDADTFFELIGSKTLFPINFNNATSGNHAGVTEVRLGAIVALKSFDEAEVSPIDSVNEGENASVTITVNEDVQSLTAVIKNAEGIEQQVTVEGKTVKATLPVGNYTYVITTSDPLYTGTIEGSFSVESKTQIVLPDVTDFHIPAMEEYAIPEAGITVDGALQDGVKANMTAVFTPAYGGGAEENITDPQRNIETAVKVIADLDKSLNKYVSDPEERKKFIIAAYNSGIGHIQDAMALAGKYGKDKHVWKDNVEKYLMLKSHEEYFNDSVCKFGYFRGVETYDLVKETIERFEQYKKKIQHNNY